MKLTAADRMKIKGGVILILGVLPSLDAEDWVFILNEFDDLHQAVTAEQIRRDEEDAVKLPGKLAKQHSEGEVENFGVDTDPEGKKV